jgi:acyl-CoA thioester hydrolase
MEMDGYALPVIEAHCEYQRSARYDDELDVRTGGALISPVRVEFTYEVVRLADGTRLATGRTVHASVDRAGRPCRLPAHVRGLFA